ncbi:DUF4235 domain-containing protein [Actinotignum urinale]|uniref:DUF4235 domain-containing protein n=1 Tax=Actinotignum urinale TaxID=190146 RepID=A0AAW9HYK0_9ACTO|nr:DUF4235 domain-containing protein [Actinotignum urinale]MDY5128547.1 DUF4235 domain-containing protein [Actinotignum urinale]MDY5132618.1 DUF4235 domain-containing protein [Actinotignum urinale]MDY5151291.1 DUF4235 domain-containing protein [Actinotignum urinale]MDY5155089.1 DUF4235 domain-containing protein [Actinotignum urinale]MDY5160636.1 DUF4235 domain-containing protein [Actinotignum urinale]
MNKWNLVSFGVGIASGFVTDKIVHAAWRKTTGRDIPDLEDATAPLIEGIIFAVVSASVGAVISQLAERKVSKMALRSTEKQNINPTA